MRSNVKSRIPLSNTHIQPKIKPWNASRVLKENVSETLEVDFSMLPYVFHVEKAY
jgi:hypothetical protein